MDTTDIFWAYEMVHRLGTLVRDVNGSGGGVSDEFVSLNLMFDQLVTREPLRATTLRLFRDGHWARAVEEGYKTLNQVVKAKSGVDLDGQALMQHCFSEKKPLLLINGLKTSSERSEQNGYQMILSGVMVGIRNPRAHDPELSDSPQDALELLIIANHLLGIVDRSTYFPNG